MAHVEAAVFQRASSVEPTPGSNAAAGVEGQPAQGGRQTRTTTTTTTTPTGMKLSTTVNLLQLYKVNKIIILFNQLSKQHEHVYERKPIIILIILL